MDYRPIIAKNKRAARSVAILKRARAVRNARKEFLATYGLQTDADAGEVKDDAVADPQQ